MDNNNIRGIAAETTRDNARTTYQNLVTRFNAEERKINTLHTELTRARERMRVARSNRLNNKPVQQQQIQHILIVLEQKERH
ncbi:hypothetical protein [Spiroplasma endosymbiont of Nebria brevicollis]|uniref:hypothetical protein n=1 Tax=Spiroplasma endosymbiont of Nebria brevicollis TaxID=3066284 RepID=UPI00313AB52E